MLMRSREPADVDAVAAGGAGALVRQAVGLASQGLALAARLTAVVPSLLSRLLAALAGLLQRASETTAETAGVPTAVEVERSRGRRRALMLFGGGFVAGTATGFVAARALEDHPDPGATVLELPRRDGAAGGGAG